MIGEVFLEPQGNLKGGLMSVLQQVPGDSGTKEMCVPAAQEAMV